MVFCKPHVTWSTHIVLGCWSLYSLQMRWSPKADDNLGSASGHRVRTTALSSGLRVKGEAAMFGLLLPTMLITIIRFKDLFVSIESRHNCFSMCLKKIELFLSVCDGEIQKLGCQPLDFSLSNRRWVQEWPLERWPSPMGDGGSCTRHARSHSPQIAMKGNLLHLSLYLTSSFSLLDFTTHEISKYFGILTLSSYLSKSLTYLTL